MHFKELKPEAIQKMLQGERNVLQQRTRDNLSHYQDVPCPQCGGRGLAVLDTQRALEAGSFMYAYTSRCSSCSCLFSPDSGMIIELGNLANEKPDRIPIIRTED